MTAPTSPPPAASPLDDGPALARPRPSAARRVARMVFILVAVAVLIALVAVAWGLKRFSDISTVPVAGLTPAVGGEPTNWLLVGTDDRAGVDPDASDAGAFLDGDVDGRRGDTILVARLDRSAGAVDLLSVPRDLWVPIEGAGREGRINGALNSPDGRPRLVATVEASLGVPIHHYVEIDFAGFRRAVDALGGVPIWFDDPVRDAGSGLSIPVAGCHHLDGAAALAFARSRSLERFEGGVWRSDPTADLGRTSRQRHLMSQLAAVASREVGLTSPLLIDELAAAVGQSVILSDRTSPVDLLRAARTISGDGHVVGHALPVVDHRTEDGAQVLQLDEAAAEAVLRRFRPSTGADAPASTPTTAPGDVAGQSEASSRAATTSAEPSAGVNRCSGRSGGS